MRDYFPPEGWALPGKARWNDKEPLPFAPGAIPAGVAKVDMPGYLPLIRGGSSWPYRVTVHMPQQLWRWNSPDWLKAHEKMFALGGNGTKLNEDGTRSWSLLCYSAPETLKYLLDGCEAKWDKKDNGVFPSWVTTPSVSVSPFDQPVKCQCEACQATWKKGGASLIMGLFVKQMCEEVKKRWPDKKVIYHPYWNYQGCPEGVDYPDNLEIIVSMSGGPMALMRQDGMRRGTEANLHAWSKKVGGLIANWDYPDRGSAWTHGPVQFPHVVQDFYRTNRTILAGTYLNGSDLPDWTTSAPTLYVWMKILWNPELDVDAVLDEMCQRLYGKAGGTVRELLQLECDRWEKVSWPAPLPDQGTIPPRVFRGIWPADVVARMKSLRDKALAELADDPVGKQRFLYWTWTFDAFLKDAVTVQQEEKQ
jgi:hypothetical protein